MCLKFMGVLFALSFTHSFAHADECRVDLEHPFVRAEVCEFADADQILVSINLSHADLTQTVLKATFALSTPKLWTQLWIESGRKSLSLAEQNRLREMLFMLDPTLVSDSTLSVLDFLANFVAPNQMILDFDGTGPRETQIREQTKRYTMICEFLGRVRDAVFSVRGVLHVISALVGDPSTKCRGRCGFGCPKIYELRSAQYTQECLNHDACHTTLGTQLGECKDAFWKAAYGYAAAPDCLNRPITFREASRN